jgi:chromosomal replication initiation ATPase DnaA
MTHTKRIEEENKKEVRKYAQQLLGDKYLISFVSRDRKTKYSKDITNEIPKIKEILQIVQQELNICNDLVSRNAEIICQRYSLMYHLKNNLKFRPTSIAHVLTNEDHSIVYHACKNVSDFLDIKDEMYQDMLRKIQTIV